ncbi:histidine kinase-like ATPase, partial [Emericellopsis atlantica]
MPIAKLNIDTVRLLGSSVTISDPPSLVKELLDNAIDAGTTTIEVLISPNTVDRIHVRDNGAGIPAEDLASLGKRAHTSKLRCFEDLVGTRTLGFRGEALASANAVSKGGLTITTKTGADSVATRVKLNPRGGGVAEQKPVPAPQGTTVLVEGLFDNIAVRKQQAIKESRKALARTRDLLLSYALARPHVKLNLKVPGEPKQQWSYSPGPNPTAKHAVMQLLSKEVSAQCAVVQKKWVLETAGSTKPDEQPTISVDAVLPSTGCDEAAIRGKGAFMCIDSRPMTSTRGTGRKINSLFKSHFNKAMGRSVAAPFMQLSIQCTVGAYDPNIAPLKDEVLFTDEQKILDCLEELCSNFY